MIFIYDLHSPASRCRLEHKAQSVSENISSKPFIRGKSSHQRSWAKASEFERVRTTGATHSQVELTGKRKQNSALKDQQTRLKCDPKTSPAIILILYLVRRNASFYDTLNGSFLSVSNYIV